jgi:ABC-type antimicrobial peptide transport system permease subunit
LVIGEGMKLTAIGIAAGLISAFALTRVMRSLLVGVGSSDPVTFGSVMLLFVVVAVFAAWLPARRAARLNPLVALREE